MVKLKHSRVSVKGKSKRKALPSKAWKARIIRQGACDRARSFFKRPEFNNKNPLQAFLSIPNTDWILWVYERILACEDGNDRVYYMMKKYVNQKVHKDLAKTKAYKKKKAEIAKLYKQLRKYSGEKRDSFWLKLDQMENAFYKWDELQETKLTYSFLKKNRLIPTLQELNNYLETGCPIKLPHPAPRKAKKKVKPRKRGKTSK